jgi:nicotinamidase-related amidase
MITALDKNTALVLIDLQNGIVQLPVATHVADVIANAAKLVAAFRKANLPIVIVNVKPAGASLLTRKDAKPPQRTLSEDFFKIVPEVKTEPDDIFITKPSWNAFSNPALDEELKKRNVTGIVLAGIATSIGVEGTGRAAYERGYNIAFAQDAMTDMFAEAHAHSLKFIFPRIGEVDDTEKIIEFL